jgi:aminopeptidase N
MPKPQSAPKTIYLSDYQPPDYRVDSIDLLFDLHESQTLVQSKLSLQKRSNGSDTPPLKLNGKALQLNSVAINGKALSSSEYILDDDCLIIPNVPTSFELAIETEINPQANTALSGLYLSSGNFCTQCEAEGFRRITYMMDRPDVMARYTTTIVADKARYPVLLSNGNLSEAGELASDSTRHWAKWIDPFPKPTYLFALVAGDLAHIEDQFITQSGRQVTLQIFVQSHNLDKCQHAMLSLKKAMRWDEEVYGREYDLDIYMIVAVDDFNMGAMENKGLNVFNSKYVLAKPDTATDIDYEHIEGVIAHEYFHNWSGNRVTCRDWFQLSLKEGFTVFRDQQFSADMTSHGVKRIQEVNILRSQQFQEDASPMAHPVRPDSYVEIDNFYTVTVYNKGAEVVRMLHHLLGAERFRNGTDCYFERHDGQAVTTDDFVKALEDANQMDLSQFRRWYVQAGTPELEISRRYDE